MCPSPRRWQSVSAAAPRAARRVCAVARGADELHPGVEETRGCARCACRSSALGSLVWASASPAVLTRGYLAWYLLTEIVASGCRSGRPTVTGGALLLSPPLPVGEASLRQSDRGRWGLLRLLVESLQRKEDLATATLRREQDAVDHPIAVDPDLPDRAVENHERFVASGPVGAAESGFRGANEWPRCSSVPTRGAPSLLPTRRAAGASGACPAPRACGYGSSDRISSRGLRSPVMNGSSFLV